MDSLVRPRTSSPRSPPIKHARSLSPRSVMVEYDSPEDESSNDFQELPHLAQPSALENPDYDDFFRTGADSHSAFTHRPNKRKLPSANLSPRTVLNLRHRQVSDETVKWLANTHPVSDTDDSDYSYEPLPCRALYSDPREDETISYAIRQPVEELWLGPVFESSQTVLTSIASLPISVTHLDLDLRNALHLLPQAMPLLFSKHHLQTLSLRVFGDAGVVELAKWMNQNPNLERLDLRGNRIGSKGARTLFDAIMQAAYNGGLEDLNLSCNCILHGDGIGELLKSDSKMRTLDLSYNWLGNEEVRDICKGLCQNKSLKELNLYGCHRISHKGMKTILRCLQKHNTSLHKIGLQAFDEEGERLIDEINYWLRLNRAGRYLIKTSMALPLVSNLERQAPQNNQETVPSGLWSHVLQKSNQDPESMFHLLREGFGARIIRNDRP